MLIVFFWGGLVSREEESDQDEHLMYTLHTLHTGTHTNIHLSQIRIRALPALQHHRDTHIHKTQTYIRLCANGFSASERDIFTVSHTQSKELACAHGPGTQ